MNICNLVKNIPVLLILIVPLRRNRREQTIMLILIISPTLLNTKIF